MNKQQLRAQIVALQDATMDENKNFRTAYDEGKFDALTAVDALLDSLEEEPESSIWHDSNKEQPNFTSTVVIWSPEHKNGEIISRCTEVYSDRIWAYIDDLFAKCQKENLWKPADGDDLPDIDREVIVLYQPYPCEGNEYAVSFAHRPKEYWDGKNIETDEVTRYYPKRYDKGGWNVPDVKFWLDLELPIQKGE